MENCHEISAKLAAGPLRASLGPRELRSFTGPLAGCLTSEGSPGPSDTAGPEVAYPLTPLSTALAGWTE